MAVRPGTSVPIGRDERRGDLVDPSNPTDPQTGAPAFTRAGKTYTFSPNPADPGTAAPPSILERACSNADFMVGVIETVVAEIRQFIDTHTAPIGGIIATVAAVGGLSTLLALVAPLAVILPSRQPSSSPNSSSSGS